MNKERQGHTTNFRDFVELNRYFIPIEKDREPNLDLDPELHTAFTGWINWRALLKYRRVVLLAEALCGKTQEFLNQCRELNRAGTSSFYLRIDDLADRQIEEFLDPDEGQKFRIWLAGHDDGVFFLDSVDEARINRKSFRASLINFSHSVGRNLQRTRVFISCRVTDWRTGEDYQVVKKISLPGRCRKPTIHPIIFSCNRFLEVGIRLQASAVPKKISKTSKTHF